MDMKFDKSFDEEMINNEQPGASFTKGRRKDDENSICIISWFWFS